VQLRAIDDACIADAIALLSRGFPERAPSFWTSGLERLLAYRARTGVGPIGQLMLVGGQPVGVILTIESRRRHDTGERTLVNLSSWFVEAKYRWLAPQMLRSVVADASVVYTDLSPSLETSIINERLGFSLVSRGVLLFFLPWSALWPRSDARVVPFDLIPSGALGSAQHELLAHHQELGCISAALQLGDGYHPLILHTPRRKSFRVARLLFGESRRQINGNMAAIARFLMRRGIMFLTMHADLDDDARGAIVWNQFAPVQVKGEWHRGGVDQAYSELALLRL
jgi:hypothetical protein